MSSATTATDERFYRDADRAVLGGVCAGIAAHLGFNLKVTRFLMFIAFLMATPVVTIGYLAAVFLIPAKSNRRSHYDGDRKIFGGCRSRRRRRREKHAGRESPPASVRAEIVRDKCRDLDARLARLEKHVTSKKFQIEQELSRL